jgi:hypothetical protein
VGALESENGCIEGLVNEVGLERDEERFGSFKIKFGIVMNPGKSVTYKQGEKIMNQLRRHLLGKKVEIKAVTFPCLVCGKGFNTELGVKRHMRLVHDGKKKAKKKSGRGKQIKPKTRKRGSKKKSR